MLNCLFCNSKLILCNSTIENSEYVCNNHISPITFNSKFSLPIYKFHYFIFSKKIQVLVDYLYFVDFEKNITNIFDFKNRQDLLKSDSIILFPPEKFYSKLPSLEMFI